jgi:hypothetical protein
MFGFINKNKLIKDDLAGIAKLMFQDVSKDPWDHENLTKRNLDFSIESVRYIDRYAKRLLAGEYEDDLLKQHFDNMVYRLGAYIGEVIKRNIDHDLQWYEADSVYRYSKKFYKGDDNENNQTVLYSKKQDAMINPLKEVSKFLKGNSSAYPHLLGYVEETIKKEKEIK